MVRQVAIMILYGLGCNVVDEHGCRMSAVNHVFVNLGCILPQKVKGFILDRWEH